MPNMPFLCNTCNVSLNSQEQLAQHQSGSKHLKKLKAAGIAATVVSRPGFSSSATTTGKKTYGNFVASDTLMPLTAQLITPPKSLGVSTTSVTNIEVVPPPPPPPPPQPKQATTPFISATLVNKVNPPPPPPPQPTVKQQPRAPRVNPVVQAVVDNALGKLPLKRKAYDGHCEICKVIYTSESHEKQHLMGSKHAKKAKIAAAAQGNIPLAAFTGFNCTYCNVVLNSLEQLTAHREGQKHKQTVLKLQKQGKVQEECKDVTVVKV
ncbi:zinc finger protein 385A-like [Saccostrea echinata]|uniref:zinc finger protein 385A-like n=1 Tax=Saccostrea echinata TaxID=191078 RepID=UPI002A80A462|nr:zinc finger protein 385A-like [Saccostrea echinata]